eukprot:m.255938 g.255938  ORF g.255938 m.255938 type:complete len:382 (+) comp11013_c0_seq1:952-2097(+)
MLCSNANVCRSNSGHDLDRICPGRRSCPQSTIRHPASLTSRGRIAQHPGRKVSFRRYRHQVRRWHYCRSSRCGSSRVLRRKPPFVHCFSRFEGQIHVIGCPVRVEHGGRPYNTIAPSCFVGIVLTDTGEAGHDPQVGFRVMPDFAAGARTPRTRVFQPENVEFLSTSQCSVSPHIRKAAWASRSTVYTPPAPPSASSPVPTELPDSPEEESHQITARRSSRLQHSIDAAKMEADRGILRRGSSRGERKRRGSPTNRSPPPTEGRRKRKRGGKSSAGPICEDHSHRRLLQEVTASKKLISELVPQVQTLRADLNAIRAAQQVPHRQPTRAQLPANLNDPTMRAPGDPLTVRDLLQCAQVLQQIKHVFTPSDSHVAQPGSAPF